MGKGPKSHHVVPNPGGGWDVRRGGASRATVHTDTKQQAVDRGREISRKQGTELRVHKEGRIARSDSHGSDPNPPRDRNN